MGLLLAHVHRAGGEDHRFQGKGIVERASLLVPATCVGMPIVWAAGNAARRVRREPLTPYPWWMDDLLISIVALDLAGNVFDLYDRYDHFDLLPHGHGGGAILVVLAWAFRLPMGRAFALATAGHALLELQEWLSDVVYGFHNWNGPMDTLGDLGSGLVGSVVYGAAFEHLVRRAGLEPPSPLPGG